jgi:hypothetical protein
MTTKRKKLPYGISNFGALIEQGYYYIDKTRFIELLENEQNKTILFTRPRKFGKSLLTSMLSYYYDFNYADKFDSLFGELYIGKNPTPFHNSYVVLNLDFSGIDTSDEKRFYGSFSDKVESSVRSMMLMYEWNSKVAEKIKELLSTPGNSYVGVKALNFAFDLAQKLQRKVYVIIDEYDHFANDLMAMGSDEGDELYKRMTGANSVVRDFYETLKAGTKTVVDRILMVGITPIMLDDLTSGFNISNNISLQAKYNEILGFTMEEVNKFMDETGVDRSLINVDLEYFYNGYIFHKKAENKVFNSSMVLYYFGQILSDGKPPEYLIDDNLKTDYGRLRRLIQSEANRSTIMEIVKNNTISGDVISKFSLNQLTDSKCFTSLLYYMGLLTIEQLADGDCRLKIPNYSIRIVYWEYIEQMMEDDNEDVLIDLSRLKDVVKELAKDQNPRPFIDYISQNIVSRLSNRDLERFDEKYLKIILLNNLFYGKFFIPISETEVTSGYTDIYLKRSGLYRYIPSEWVWEIKYVKKSDENNASLIAAKRAEAVEQIEKYRASHLFRDRTDMRYLIVIFIGKDKVEVEEIL